MTPHRRHHAAEFSARGCPSSIEFANTSAITFAFGDRGWLGANSSSLPSTLSSVALRMVSGVLAQCVAVLVISISALSVGTAAAEPGKSRSPGQISRSAQRSSIVMEIESKTFELHVRDARNGARGPTIRVALGSPGQSTPTGEFPLERIILSPSWIPGTTAKSTGAEPESASLDTPMGAVKIPFASNGVIALHGGGDRRALGKPISAGCIRATDADLLRVVAWLDAQDALAQATEVQNGEIHREFRRPIQLVVR